MAALALACHIDVALADPSDLCISAARIASAQTGVPMSVMNALSLTETGRNRGGQMRPWPWTVNMEGEGHWFDDAGAALAYVRTSQARGARSFDIGRFQINHRWHGEHFASFEAMFDPVTNALYAARFLAQLHEESGDWSVAAGAYHSRTQEHATRYRSTFDRYHAMAISSGADSDGPIRVAAATGGAPILPRLNSFPLLQAGRGGLALGSLVPIAGGS